MLDMGMTTSTVHPDAPLRAQHLPWRLSTYTGIAVALAVAGRLPFVSSMASPDEGGYLLVGSQWHAGTSIYGNYWVARPPLLIGVDGLASALGGTLALRVIGILAVLVCVLLAATIRREVVGAVDATLVQVAPVAVVAIFMTTPLFGNAHVDGELLSAPFILCGVLAYVRAAGAAHRRTALAWLLAAGAAATSAAMMKQNSIDVFVFVAACLVMRLAAGNSRSAVRAAAVFAVGAVGAAVVIVGVAVLRGTSLGGLWDAVVSFRFQASAALSSSSAPASYGVRLQHLVLAGLASCAPIVIAVLAWQSRRGLKSSVGRPRCPLDLRWPATALVAWEVVSIAGGESYWLHYLLDLVPGITVLAVAAAQRPTSARRWLGGALTVAALSTGISTAVAADTAPDYSSDWGTISYLRDHARAGDTAVVAFGHPNILWDSHLTSPYEQLWSLPVRVRDPRLSDFGSLLASPSAPTWVVVSGGDLYSWGIDAGRADRVLEASYHPVANESPYVIWHIDQSTR
jgi:hypothetical protein